MPLYAFGSNGSGQLGIGSTEDTKGPKLCVLPNPLPGRPKKIVTGGNHTLLLLDDGTLYYSGSSRDGRVQEGSALPYTTIFQKAYISVLGVKIRLCSAWWDGSVFVDTDNCVSTAGLGSKGEQGTGAISASLGLQGLKDFPPNRGQERGKIMDLASGVDHTLAVIADGTVWGWGNGRKGKLGYDKDFVWAPHKFKHSGDIVARAVCGRDFTFLMYENGRHEVLDTNKWELQSKAPGPFPNWTDVGASWGSIFVLKNDRKIESWGRDDHGQLAPPNLPDIEQFAIGSEHVIALTKEGEVISWGWGEHGNCGVDTDKYGDVKGRWNQIPVDPSESVLGVGAGCATSFFWTESSNIQATSL